jgi:hypothetical protein
MIPPVSIPVSWAAGQGLFVATPPWASSAICAPALNTLRNRLARTRPQISIEFALALDEMAQRRYAAQMALGSVKQAGGPDPACGVRLPGGECDVPTSGR